jgi:predicted transcriptional regulator
MAAPKFVSVKVSEAYWRWLQQLAERDRGSLPGTIDRALARYAEATGFEAPPRRTTRRTT